MMGTRKKQKALTMILPPPPFPFLLILSTILFQENQEEL
jgi:hypothetical protein